MKFKLALFVSSLVLITACDGPTRLRTPAGSTSDNVSTDTKGTDSGSGNGSTSFTTGSTGGGTTTNSTMPAGFEACNPSNAPTQAALGTISVCQSSANELSFRLQFSTTDQSDGTCIFPMYKDSAGNATYLGNPQCTKHNAGQIIMGNVVKNRTGYESYPVNNVMVMKYSSTNAFLQCMNAYGNSYSSCRASTCAVYNYNPSVYQSCMNTPSTSCQTNAQTYMTNMCNNFRSNYAYLSIDTK